MNQVNSTLSQVAPWGTYNAPAQVKDTADKNGAHSVMQARNFFCVRYSAMAEKYRGRDKRVRSCPFSQKLCP